MEVIFVRHAQAESNILPPEKGVVGSNLRLTAEGIRQARATAQYLGELAARQAITLPDTIYTSPYVRARQTARIISRTLLLPVKVDYRLKEIQKGDWHNMRVSDVIPLEASIPLSDRPSHRPPAGENWFDVAERVVEFVKELQERGEQSALIISHNHPIEAAVGKITGLDVTKWKSRPVDNASITRVYEVDGIWQSDKAIYNLKPYALGGSEV